MVNLKNLDKKVDKLLESETSDSLTRWLLNERNKDFSKFSDIEHLYKDTTCGKDTEAGGI